MIENSEILGDLNMEGIFSSFALRYISSLDFNQFCVTRDQTGSHPKFHFKYTIYMSLWVLSIENIFCDIKMSGRQCN